MWTSRWLTTATLTVLFSSPLSAADLTKIERKIAREPIYKTTPRYCLLVFGPEAKTRVWLVHDGDTLYVDRNGNGDLTEAGEKVAAKESEEYWIFDVGDIVDGKLRHKYLQITITKRYAADPELPKPATDPMDRSYEIGVQVEMPGWNGGGVDGRIVQAVSSTKLTGELKFSDKPANAPIIHFGGPWQIALGDYPQLTIGREREMHVYVGTPGLGAGTTAFVSYEGIVPGNCYPVVEITYPRASAKEEPVTERYELKERC